MPAPSLTDATDGRYVGLVIDPATFERVARCAAKKFGAEFKDLSGETAIEDLVPIQERHPTDSWLVPFLLHMALEDEFEIDFDEGELGQILENAPGGGYTLASWVWAVQRGLNNELCVAQLANWGHRAGLAGWLAADQVPCCCLLDEATAVTTTYVYLPISTPGAVAGSVDLVVRVDDHQRVSSAELLSGELVHRLLCATGL